MALYPLPIARWAVAAIAVLMFLLFFVVLAVIGTMNLARSRIGRAFIAIRDQDIAAEIIGIDIFRYKLLSFGISSFYAGVTGVLYTYYLGIANYEQFQINVSIDYLAMVIIGGRRSGPPPLVCAGFVLPAPHPSRPWLPSLDGPCLCSVRRPPHTPRP